MKDADNREVSQFCKRASLEENWGKLGKGGMFISTWIDKEDLSLHMFDILSVKRQREDARMFKIRTQSG